MSCSSSTKISPGDLSGVNTAERVPSTAAASPARARHHARYRSSGGIAECSTHTVPPSRARTRATSCGVSAISGTRNSACRPAATHFLGGVQIDLGLAAAGDAVQQKRGEAVLRGDCIGGRELLRVHLNPRRVFFWRRILRRGRKRAQPGLHRAFFQQLPQRSAAIRKLPPQFGRFHPAGAEQVAVDARLRRRARQIRRAAAAVNFNRAQVAAEGRVMRRRAAAQRRRQRGVQRLAERVVVVARRPQQQFQQRIAEQVATSSSVSPTARRRRGAEAGRCETATPTSLRRPNGTRTRAPAAGRSPSQR